MKNFKINIVVLLITGLVFNTGCKKLLDIDASNLVNEKNSWSSITDTRSSLLGTYGLLRAALAENNAHWLYGELRQSGFEASSKRDLEAIINGKLNSPYPLLQDLSDWRRFYAVINSANLFIERSAEVLEKDPQYTNLNHEVDVAQMRAIKGFAYFYMVRIWGDLPLWKQSYDGAFPKLPRSEAKAVLDYAENELREAAKVLPFRYGMRSAAYFPGLYYGFDNTRWDGSLITSVAANAMLAHIAVWDNRYLDASVHVDFVLDNASQAGLVSTSVNDLTKADGFFLNVKASQMFALGMSWDRGESTVTGHVEDLMLAAPLVSKPIPDVFMSATTILNIFTEPTDDRFRINASTGDVISPYFTDFTGLRPVFSKIKVIGDGSGTLEGALSIYSSPIVFSRMEEILLLKAEILAVLGEEASSLLVLNDVRYRRGLLDLDPHADLIDEIFKERKRELLGEGWSWYDLIRYKRIKANDPGFNALIANDGIYWPIATRVLSNNSSIEQNQYWR